MPSTAEQSVDDALAEGREYGFDVEFEDATREFVVTHVMSRMQWKRVSLGGMLAVLEQLVNRVKAGRAIKRLGVN